MLPLTPPALALHFSAGATAVTAPRHSPPPSGSCPDSLFFLTSARSLGHTLPLNSPPPHSTRTSKLFLTSAYTISITSPLSPPLPSFLLSAPNSPRPSRPRSAPPIITSVGSSPLGPTLPSSFSYCPSGISLPLAPRPAEIVSDSSLLVTPLPTLSDTLLLLFPASARRVKRHNSLRFLFLSIRPAWPICSRTRWPLHSLSSLPP